MTQHPQGPGQPQGHGQGEPMGQPYSQPQGYGQPYGHPQGYSQPTPPQLSPSEERNLGMLAHLVPLAAMVLSAGVLGFVASIVIYVMYKDRGPFVRAHAANSLNVQIITTILAIISIPLMFVLIGFLTLGLVIVWALVLHIMGAVKANAGEWWDPPLVPRLVR